MYTITGTLLGDLGKKREENLTFIRGRPGVAFG
jgi:hypothetical protein